MTTNPANVNVNTANPGTFFQTIQPNTPVNPTGTVTAPGQGGATGFATTGGATGGLFTGATNPGVQPFDDKTIDAALDNMSDEFKSLTMDAASLTMLSDDFTKIFQEATALFAFAGFNPEEVFNTLKGYAFGHGLDVGTFILDIAFLISYYMKRGTTLQRRGIANSVTTEAQRKVQILIQRYRIQDNVSVTQKGPRIVTLARIMNTFPEVVGTRLAEGLAGPIGQRGIIPLCISFAGGASLIPTTKNWDPLFEKFLDWAVSFDKIVNRLRRQASNTTFDESASRENARMWADLARNNSRHSNGFRERFLKDWAFDFELGVTWTDDSATAFNWTIYEQKETVLPDVSTTGSDNFDNNNNNNAPTPPIVLTPGTSIATTRSPQQQGTPSGRKKR